MTRSKVPVVLLVLDGWGYSEEASANAIAAADTPVWDRLWGQRPSTLIRTSGASVGLPGGQMGNSEVGHLNIGAGRVVYQEFTRVSRSIRTGSFFSNRTLTDAVDRAVAAGRAVHIMGLLSPGGVHSHEKHLQAMVRLAVERGAPDVRIHAFLDGRDTPPRSVRDSLQAMEALLRELGTGRIVSLIGRYYAMDRDNRWPRIQEAYDLLTGAAADFEAKDALAALEAAYERGESDEFVRPTRLGDAAAGGMRDGDSLVFMNYRSDRARQLTRAFAEPSFSGFRRLYRPRLGALVSLTEYSRDYPLPVAFPPERIHNSFGQHISRLGLRQLRLAETEKYAHVTFFFNGGREKAFEGEERILVPSPDVSTYDLAPAMSADAVTDRLVEAIALGRFDAIVCNYANPDMVGHTGKMEAAVRAIEAVDRSLGHVIDAVESTTAEVLITADHGNAERMSDAGTGQPHTAHTENPVPLVYVGRRRARLMDGGALCDIAPTLLAMMGLGQPREMQGQSLIRFTAAEP
ncbi:MAG: 2,3-bisphosphoglycerate-independent phosphoglycerate mutase [Pseudomonadota bacterium]|nr:2,3-bisphosphoglycerate-independent phosphoglycerate mutase [Pseudomonadota bacterium]